MKRLVLILLPFMLMMQSCKDTPYEPNDTQEFQDKIEFYYQKCLDDSCTKWEDVIMDTTDGSVPPHIRVVVKERLFAGDSITLNVLYNNVDSIYQGQRYITTNDTAHFYRMTTLRLPKHGSYNAYAYYIRDGIKKEIPPAILVFK